MTTGNDGTTMTATERVLAAIGSGMIALGTVLEWIVVNPFHDGAVPMIYLQGMSSGTETVGIVLLPAAIAVLVAVALRPERWASALSVGVGVLAVPIVVVHVASYAEFHWTFVPGPGVAMVLAGGSLLAVVGGRALRRSTAREI